MQWRTIPGHPAYEINEQGRIRKADTHYVITVKGRYAKLSTGGAIVRCLVVDLVAAAFAPSINHRAAIPPRTSRRDVPGQLQIVLPVPVYKVCFKLIVDLATGACTPVLNAREAIPPRTTARSAPVPAPQHRAAIPTKTSIERTPPRPQHDHGMDCLAVSPPKDRATAKPSRRPKSQPSSAGFYKPIRTHGTPARMNLDHCPWEAGEIEGTARGADPVLGF